MLLSESLIITMNSLPEPFPVTKELADLLGVLAYRIAFALLKNCARWNATLIRCKPPLALAIQAYRSIYPSCGHTAWWRNGVKVGTFIIIFVNRNWLAG